MYRYSIQYTDPDDGYNCKTLEGLVCGADYGAAANKVVEYYGKEYIFSVSIEELEPLLEKEEINEMFDNE